ncbi:uncharacterized protein F5147DRAFT_775425 [Suillus discolor]|uniref:Uncharacterized protein n=1 Tax=Suillus discolor TaxID=1912936 RepID=A0A9P7F394_9AGAM|nr:uncharacterized protein F5147DRAFT_775425 [Suillus discolor]KAG2105105.1 hypothetical protein F5147DRAFT_775425 [Suillus discolor]
MVHTCPTNASKRPAQVVLDAKQKRCTTAQLKEDKARAEKERDEQDEKTRQAITQVAAAQKKAAIQQKNTVSTKKPRPCLVGKGATTTASSSHAQAVADDDDDKDNDSQVLGRRKRIQRTDHRDAVNAVRIAMQPSHPRASDATGNGNKLTDIKKIAVVSGWAQRVNTKLESGFKVPLHLESASSLSHPTGSALSRVTHATTNATTTATAPPATPEGSMFNDDVEAEERTPDEADGPERLVAYTLANMGKTMRNQKLMDVIEVQDIPQPLTPPVPSQLRLLQYGSGNTRPHITRSEPKDIAVDLEGQEDAIVFVDNDDDDSGVEHHGASAAMRNMGGNKRVTASASVEIVDNAPPSKRIKREAESEVAVGEPSKAKYKNSDLPPGCLDRNLWRGVFIPTVAHAAGGENVHPWLIEDDTLILILTKMWNIVYADNPSLKNYKIVLGGAVYHVAKQCLSEWRGGFGSAAVMIITSLMASDSTYETDQEHIDFAKFWLEDNRFLFSDISSDDPEAWTGMWQSTFVLQTFAAHLNYTQGRVEVPALNSENDIMRASLALAAGAVKRALYLLSVGAMSFTITTATGKGKKKATTICKGKALAVNGDIWEAVIGENESFSEPLWGYDTCMLLQAIKNVPSTAMQGIVQQAQQYMKASSRGGRSKGADEPEEEIDEEYVNLLAFR